MRCLKAALLVVALVVLGGVASADDMVLTRGGDLYRVSATADGLAVSSTLVDGSGGQLLVPQTTDAQTSCLQVGVDDVTGSIYVVWQEGVGLLGRVQIAVHADGTWVGPMTLAGGDGTAAISPQLLVFHHSAEVTADDGSTVEVSDTILHLVWWGFTTTVDDGSAFYVGVPVDEHGFPIFDAYAPVPVSSLLAYGIACPGITDAAELAYPKLFVDPQSGNPHLLATDFGQCLFQVVELQYKPTTADAAEKRRRRVVIFGDSEVMPVSRQLPLDSAKVEVGHNLSVVMYWDHPESVDYMLLSEAGSSPLRSLALGDTLSRDRAVELIKTLTR